jgi:hypothetical protein
LFAAVNETLQAFAKDPQWRFEGRLGLKFLWHERTVKNPDSLQLYTLLQTSLATGL